MSNKTKYQIEYENENEFKKLEHNLRKYNMKAFKEYLFTHIPDLQNGNFKNSTKNNDIYEIKLSTDKFFKKVHGECKLIFKVKDNKIILLEIAPKQILLETHKQSLMTYKGVLISKENKEKDMFLVNLLNMIDKDH